MGVYILHAVARVSRSRMFEKQFTWQPLDRSRRRDQRWWIRSTFSSGLRVFDWLMLSCRPGLFPFSLSNIFLWCVEQFCISNFLYFRGKYVI